MTPAEQAHLRILKIVDAEPEISQRQLAERLGVSLGKANYLIAPSAECHTTRYRRHRKPIKK